MSIVLFALLVVGAMVAVAALWHLVARRVMRPRTTPCPSCGSPVREGLLDCPECGFDLRSTLSA